MVPSACTVERFRSRNRVRAGGVLTKSARLKRRLRMHDEDELAVMGIRMTGSIILSLIWTLLVSTLLFALAG